MPNLIQQPRQPFHLQTLSSAISVAEVKESQRQRYQIIASNMSAYFNNANERIDHHMFNHFCERLLPVTFRDWMTNR